MKNSTIVSAVLGLALLSSAAGCAKSTDLGKMQEETIASVKVQLAELDILQRRYDDLARRKSDMPAANEHLAGASKAINEGRTLAASAPTQVATAAKSGNPEALTQAHFDILHQLQEDIAIAKDHLVAYENATTFATAKTAAPAPIPTPAPTPDTPVANDGDAAAKMPAGTAPAGHTTDIPCSAEIALQCPEGQIDGCMKTPATATHACVAK